MAALRELPKGQLYVCSGGDQFLDSVGNVYVRETSAPAMVKSPPRKRPPNPLPDATQRHIDSAKMALVAAPEEHFIAFGLSESGHIVFEHQETSGAWNHCSVDIKGICTQLGKHTSAVLAFHNHITGDTRPSAEDAQTTQRLKTALAAYDVTLIKHEIIPGDLDLQATAARESAPELDYPTDWHARQAALEHRQATEPAWLQRIREGLERRYAR